MAQMKTILIEGTEYELTPAYLEGARAYRAGTPWSCNPYDDDTQECDDWANGHVNESEKDNG